ncbi:MAG: hypothetical protein JWO22_1250 [Frankiales bacterium]|nr:hypothetical protein [Frankiales bacterium]
MTIDIRRKPRHRDGQFTFATDNPWSTSRWAVHFDDDCALIVWVNASHSAWSDRDNTVPHLAGDRVAWSRLPAAVRRLVWERCVELDAVSGVG